MLSPGKPAASEIPSHESSLQDEDIPPVKPDFFDDETTPPGEPLILSADIAVPAPLNRYLKSYQREGVKFFYDKYAAGKGFVLGDEMGWVDSWSLHGSSILLIIGSAKRFKSSHS